MECHDNYILGNKRITNTLSKYQYLVSSDTDGNVFFYDSHLTD